MDSTLQHQPTHEPSAAHNNTLRTPSRFAELLLLTVGIPALITAVNYMALLSGQAGDWSPSVLVPVYGLYIVEIAVLGFILGVGVRHHVLRWSVFLWAMALIDLQMFVTVAHLHNAWPAYRGGTSERFHHALFAGQLGMLTVWGVLGGTPAARRLPLIAIAMGITIYLGFNSTSAADHSGVFLFAQTIATISLCGLMWAFGFRVERITRSNEPRGLRLGERLQSVVRRQVQRGATSLLESSLPQGRRMQFSMWHLFVWVSVLAPILAVARVLDWTVVQDSGTRQILGLACVSLSLAIAAVVAMWAALGKENVGVRFFGLLMIAPLVGGSFGALHGWIEWSTWYANSPWMNPASRWPLIRQYLVFWLTWTALSSFFLAGMLVIFRASGYVLLRRMPLKPAIESSS